MGQTMWRLRRERGEERRGSTREAPTVSPEMFSCWRYKWVWIIQWWCWGMYCMVIYIRKARRVVFKSQFQALCKCICWFTSNSNRSNLQVNCDSDSWHWTASETSRATQSINQQTNRASDPHLTITKHQSRNQRLMRAFQLTNTTLTHNVHCNSHFMERQCQKIHRYLLKSNKATDARL